MKETKRYGLVALVALIWLVLDQLTKAAITAGIAPGRGFSVIDGCFNIVHVLNRGAFAAKDRERKQASHNGNGAQDAGNGEFMDIGFFHTDSSSETDGEKRLFQRRFPSMKWVNFAHKGRSKLAGFLSRRNTASHRCTTRPKALPLVRRGRAADSVSLSLLPEENKKIGDA